MLMRTDPFHQLDRLAEEVFGTPTRPAAVPIDACRRGDVVALQLDLPGVVHDSIDLTVERNVLTVRAERRRAPDEVSEWLITERPQGTFSRQLFLGDTLDMDHISADYLDGVLTITIPVAQSAKPRKVAVNSEQKEPASIGA